MFNLNTFVIAFIFGVVFFFVAFNFQYSYLSALRYVIVVSISRNSIRPLVATTSWKKTSDVVPNLNVKGTYKVLAFQTPSSPFSKLVTIGNHAEVFEEQH